MICATKSEIVCGRVKRKSKETQPGEGVLEKGLRTMPASPWPAPTSPRRVPHCSIGQLNRNCRCIVCRPLISRQGAETPLPPELASGAAPCKPTPQTTWVAAASGGLSRFIGPSTTVHVGWLLCVGKRGMSPMDAAVRVLGGAVFLGTPSGASSGAFPTTA